MLMELISTFSSRPTQRLAAQWLLGLNTELSDKLGRLSVSELTQVAEGKKVIE